MLFILCVVCALTQVGSDNTTLRQHVPCCSTFQPSHGVEIRKHVGDSGCKHPLHVSKYEQLSNQLLVLSHFEPLIPLVNATGATNPTRKIRKQGSKAPCVRRLFARDAQLLPSALGRKARRVSTAGGGGAATVAVGTISMAGVGSYGAANGDRGHINVAYYLFCGQSHVSHRVTKNGPPCRQRGLCSFCSPGVLGFHPQRYMINIDQQIGIGC